jgi:hypothetical protein
VRLRLQAKRLWTVLRPSVAVSVGTNTRRRQLGPCVRFADAEPKRSQDLGCVAWLRQLESNLPGRPPLAPVKITISVPCHSF